MGKGEGSGQEEPQMQDSSKKVSACQGVPIEEACIERNGQAWYFPLLSHCWTLSGEGEVCV